MLQQYCLKCSGAAGLQALSFSGVVNSTVFRHCRQGPSTKFSSQVFATSVQGGFDLVLPYDVNLVVGHTLVMASKQAPVGGGEGGAGG